MSEKMLIDASHPEETRVVVVRGNRIEEFDFESQHKKQLRGNIYLAKVTRVEPSLQAAFVDYGGNRHGFLAFSEIHPDYYQIPLADRQALLEAEAEDADDDGDFESAEVEDKPAKKPGRRGKKAAEAENGEGEKRPRRARRSRKKQQEGEAEAAENADMGEGSDAGGTEAPVAKEAAASVIEEATGPEATSARDKAGADASEDEGDKDNDNGPTTMAAEVDVDEVSERVTRKSGEETDEADEEEDDVADAAAGKSYVESVGSEDAMEEVPDRARRKPRKQYRIQEVIKRRQILLVQVVKEERGNKGAALTTYLSLAGRYSVLMPNTARGGGISRKITSVADRKRLKEIARELEVPKGMGVILRTAGANRTRVEVKRDFEYLMRLWENVRNLTLRSTAPALVYEEGSLIKRSIRDLYNKDISEIVVSGEEGYREAKDFMKMLMPSHAKVVQPYRELVPIFARSGIDSQLDKMLQSQVTLKSGGYIIINQTEALVAIDVNSGRSTREHSIEDTALQTNLEAAEEVARQLRLRDLAGLIVIDFIDMEENRNNRAVEKKIKECLKHDRARIQVGRISHFGLLEMSRQRIRASVLESTMQICAHCGGTGHVRSSSSVALHVLRGIEEYLLKHTTHHITVRTTAETALYMLNHKRDTIIDFEHRFGLSITFASDPDVGAQHFAIDRGVAVENPVSIEHITAAGPSYDEYDDDTAIEEDESEVVEIRSEGEESQEEDEGRSRKRRRRRRRGRRGGENDEARQQASDTDEGTDDDGDEEDGVEAAAGDAEGQDDQQRQGKKRRRGKRGGRKNRDEARQGGEEEDQTGEVEVSGEGEEAAADADQPALAATGGEAAAEAEAAAAEEAPAAKAPRARRSRGRKGAAEEKAAGAEDAAPTQNAPAEEDREVDVAAAAVAPVVETAEASAETEDAGDDEEAGRRNRRAQTDISEIASKPVVTSSSKPENEEEKPKRGWWQRRGFL